MDKTAYEFMSYYGNAHSLRECREYKEKGTVVNMCKALDEIYEDGKKLGESVGKELEKKNTILNALSMNLPLEQIMNLCSCSAEYVERVRLCV